MTVPMRRPAFADNSLISALFLNPTSDALCHRPACATLYSGRLRRRLGEGPADDKHEMHDARAKVRTRIAALRLFALPDTPAHQPGHRARVPCIAVWTDSAPSDG